MKWDLTDKSFESEFTLEVEKLSGQDVSSCYQCGCCAAGCPIGEDMDYSSTKIMRLIQLGLKEEALSSNTMWLCASCNTCTTRCPLEVDLAKVMDTLRLINQAEGHKRVFDLKSFLKDLGKRSKEGWLKLLQMDIRTNIEVFSKVFLKSVRDYGRMSEMNLIANYNINSGFLFSSMSDAPVFLQKRKLAITTGDANRIAKVKRIFEKVEEIEGIKL